MNVIWDGEVNLVKLNEGFFFFLGVWLFLRGVLVCFGCCLINAPLTQSFGSEKMKDNKGSKGKIQ